MKPIIELENIRRDFIVGDETVRALRGVTFSIHTRTILIHLLN